MTPSTRRTALTRTSHLKFVPDTIYLAAFLLLAGCAAVDPHNVIGRQMGTVSSFPADAIGGGSTGKLDVAAREQAFDFVWHTINERYYNRALNGVDWNGVGMRYRPLAMKALDDEAFWEVLDRMTGELKDAHTRVESPRKVELRKRDEAISLGFSFASIEGRLAITNVNPDTDAWWAGVRPGMTLVTVAGDPA